ncbi:Cytochrome b5 type B (outer mitochondrial membrane) [Rhizophlyctis rosea]|uniref:Cytochrome b5 type B (Outer mitochondrial membrane) n=1 Tax=Rhizophlyctis rosea TaxID=64517 RepID=A0AAD5X2Y1_9FUNG|nr:Cytochrome b5 type B (outer mitochondrial membrane) [Rhizophlyctis rosea]
MSEVKLYEWSEVAEHNTRDDLWMVIEGKVYDVTKFLDEHPGGEEVLLEQGGMDATEAFEEIGHSDDSRELLKGMYKGDLKPSELGKKAAQQVKQAVQNTAQAAATEAKFGVPPILYALVPVVVIAGFLISKYIEAKH